MCGIAGIVRTQPLNADDLSAVDSMCEAQRHRGPDGKGDFASTRIALGMRRLSIIDLEGGWQPFYSEDKSIVVVANGEIYNFIELRTSLQQKGHRFQTASDCEVIVHLYEEYGRDCPRHLRGMFAFAIWDVPRNQLILARDRMGEKPLYIHQAEGVLVFASELKSLLRSGLVPFDPDPIAVDQYMHYGFVPEPGTPIRHVRKLRAAHTLTVDVSAGLSMTEDCYWRMEDAEPIDDDPPTRIRAELEDLFGYVTRADVPLGVALSGGVDSGAIAALAHRAGAAVTAFGIGYPGRPHGDERKDAAALADQLGIPFIDTELSADEMVRLFPQVVLSRDDPIADISGYGYYAVNRLAKEHKVPVMMQGQGADELFWGYDWVVQALNQSREKASGSATTLNIIADSIIQALPNHLSRSEIRQWISSRFGLMTAFERAQRNNGPTDRLVFYDLTDGYRAAARLGPSLYTRKFSEKQANFDASAPFTEEAPWPDLETLITRLLCDTYLMQNGIAQGDRLSMASSVEMRLPFVDHRLVETVVGLRKVHSDSALAPKAWLKQALNGIVPRETLDRPKRGFAPPVRLWRRKLMETYGHTIANGWLVNNGLLDPEVAQKLGGSKIPWGGRSLLAFRVLVLENWCQQMSAYALPLPHTAAAWRASA